MRLSGPAMVRACDGTGVQVWEEGDSRGLKKLKLSGPDRPWGIRREQIQRCSLVSDVSEQGLQGQHQDRNSGEEQV